ncbi:MAG: FHA domain-containing protein [Acidobacteriota bacterium]
MSWRVRIDVRREGEEPWSASFERSPIAVGALPHNDVVLNDPYVSGEHGVVMVTRGQLVYRDHSRNGSFHQGKPIQEQALGSRGVVEVPPFTIEMRLDQDEAPWHTVRRTPPPLQPAKSPPGDIPKSPPGDTPDPPPSDSAAPLAAAPPAETNPAPPVADASPVTHDGWQLRLTSGPTSMLDERFPLIDHAVRIGRSQAADLRVPIRTVSRLHAAIRPHREGGWAIIDLESANGTFVNGDRISEKRLDPGDEIKLGAIGFVIEEVRGAAPADEISDSSAPDLDDPTRPVIADHGFTHTHTGDGPPRDGPPSVPILPNDAPSSDAPPGDGPPPPPDFAPTLRGEAVSAMVADLVPPPHDNLETVAALDDAANGDPVPDEIAVPDDVTVPEDISVLTVDGALDGYRANQLGEQIDAVVADPSQRALIIDLSRTEAVGYTAISLLVDAKRRLEARDGHFALATCTPSVRDTLSLARLDTCTVTADTPEAALYAALTYLDEP